MKFSEYINEGLETNLDKAAIKVYNSLEAKEESFDYNSDSLGKVQIDVKIEGEVIYFSFKNKKKEQVVINTKFDKRNKDHSIKGAKIEITHWLKGINY